MATAAQVLLSHQVDILYDYDPTPICTGTILSSYLILTLASCLAKRSPTKLTIQTQNTTLPRLLPPSPSDESNQSNADYKDNNGDENPDENPEYKDGNADDDADYENPPEIKSEVATEEWGRETRYVDSFYTIKALGPNDTLQKDYQLAIITLDEELKWSTNVRKANLTASTNIPSQIYQLYNCFPSWNLEQRWPMEALIKETAFSNCERNAEAGLSSPIFPPGCISDTPRNAGHNNNLMCPAPLSGSGLFCETSPLSKDAVVDEVEMEHSADVKVLCGVLSSDGPLYINITNYLHGIYLPEEGPDDSDGATSIGGEEVNFTVESFPYQLSLQWTTKLQWSHKCGAVLLDDRTVLTAAHCFDDRLGTTKYRIVAGMKQLTITADGPTEQVRNITRISPHPSYTKNNVLKGNDIALLFVDTPFVLTEDVKTVWISSEDDPVLSDFNGTATGWGFSDNSETLLNNLTKVNLPLRSYTECKGMLSFFKESMICAHTGHSNVCRGDSGGPLVLQNYEFPYGQKRDLLVGITSFAGATCEDLSKPSGFTKVSSFYDWINTRWRRSTTAPKKFKCFNGKEIDEDLRCDEEFDCDDGSDERGCTIKPTEEKDIPKTRKCGGELQLVDEHDIIYRVENSKSGKMTQCVWTIYNQKYIPIELTLLENVEAHFDPQNNQLIALHNFTLHRQNFNYESINTTGQKMRLADSYTTLIFRGPAGIRDSGFHLRLKSVGGSTQENPLRFTRVDLIPTPTLQIHSYPPGNGFYGMNERVFTVLSPAQRGGRIKLNFTLGGMQTGRDWFDVISIGKQPKSLLRFSKALGRKINETVEGGRDEILLVFMSTGSPEVKRKGFQFTYSEDHPSSADARGLECGGNLTLDGDQDLVYERNPLKSNCVWVISNKRAGSSVLTLLNSRSQLFNLTDGSSLYILHNFSRRGSASHHINKFRREYHVDQPFFVLYFRSPPFSTTTGFFLKLKHLASPSSSDSDSDPSSLVASQQNALQFGKTLTTHSSQPRDFSYPVIGAHNSNSNSTQSAVIVVQPTQNNQRVLLNLKRIHLTDEAEEWLEIYTFRERPISIYRTSGSSNIKDKSFTASEGEPFVFYIKSKSNSSNLQQKKSLTFSYSEQKADVRETGFCRGVITLGRRHKIIYKTPSGQRRNCLWTVHNPHGPHSNITATHFDTANSQLFLIQDKNITKLAKDETITTKSDVVALFFRSNGKGNNPALKIDLDGVSDFGLGESSLDVRSISLAAKSQRVEQLAHPRPPALAYRNNERRFILINPEKRNGTVNKVQLHLTFIDLEPNSDRLDLYTFTKNPTNEDDGKLQHVLEFDSFDYWTNNTFLGEADEPFLLYFQSDESTVKSGFKFNYKNIRSNGN